MCVRVPRTERKARKRESTMSRASGTYRWINVQSSLQYSPLLRDIVQFGHVLVAPGRCGAAETKREDRPPRTNFLPAAHERHSGKCHGFISMLEGSGERNICFAASSLRSKNAIAETRRARSGRRAVTVADARRNDRVNRN